MAVCLHSVGTEVPRVWDVVPLLDVDSGGFDCMLTWAVLLCFVPVWLPYRVLCHAHMSSGFDLTAAHVGAIVSCLFLAHATLSAI